MAAPAGAATVSPQIPQFAAAQAAANWIVTQQAADGSIGGSLSDTVNGILALAAGHDTAAAQSALSYMEANANAYITVDGADGPGQLAVLILDAHAMNVDPTNFGGTNLPARLLATEQTSGPDAGLFGTETQLNDFFVGGYVQGLVFTALKAVGQTANAAAIGWLTGQQCPSGGWVLQSQATSFGGLHGGSLQLLRAGYELDLARSPGTGGTRRADGEHRSSALSFLTTGQDADGGWSFYQNSSAQPQPSDPQSTGLVIQALLAMGLSPTSSTFTGPGRSPVSTLLSFVVTSGTDAGAIFLHLRAPRRETSPPRIRWHRFWPD